MTQFTSKRFPLQFRMREDMFLHLCLRLKRPFAELAFYSAFFMTLYMLLQIFLVHRLIIAKWTFKWFWFRFGFNDGLSVFPPNMNLDGCRERESGIAHGTLRAAQIGLWMCIHVQIKISLYSECLIAKIAFKGPWSFCGMRGQVKLQRATTPSAVIAIRAFVRPFVTVDPLMNHKMSMLSKSFETNQTLIRFLAGVEAPMDSQLSSSRCSKVAGVT